MFYLYLYLYLLHVAVLVHQHQGERDCHFYCKELAQLLSVIMVHRHTDM